MRLGTYRKNDGTDAAFLAVERDGATHILDIAQASKGTLGSEVLTILGAGPAAIDQLRELAENGRELMPLNEVTLLPPIPRPGKLVCIAGNFQSHVREFGGVAVDKSLVVPKLFIKPSTTVLAPGAAVSLPTVSATVDWELELAIVIGKGGRDIPVEDARDHIAGYSIINDLSARTMDWGIQDRKPDEMDGFFDWLAGKWPDGFAPFGPWITLKDAVEGDPNALDMSLAVNGEVWQQGTTAEMIFNPEEIISFGSRFMTWEPGDVIAGGTLDGNGHPVGKYLKKGDVLEATIGNLGTLTTPVEEIARGEA